MFSLKKNAIIEKVNMVAVIMGQKDRQTYS